MEDLASLRVEIDDINDRILDLFQQRMDVAARIADVKRELGRPVSDPAREREILAHVRSAARPEMGSPATVLFSLLMEMASARQERLLHPTTKLRERIEDAVEHTPKTFPADARVACQGGDGSDSCLACERLFRHPSIAQFKDYDGVVKAVDAGFCAFGILPLETAEKGTEHRIYDLMMEHDLHIVRTVRMGRGALEGLASLEHVACEGTSSQIRLACVTKDLRIYPGADRASFMMVLPHEPGSLYRVLARLYALDINLTKVESRPLPQEDYKYMFYFDMDVPVYSEEFGDLVCELGDLCDDFKYLGSYTEAGR